MTLPHRSRRAFATEALEARQLLTGVLDINPATHALSFVAQSGFSNAITVQLISGSPTALQISDGGSDDISLSTNAQNAGWNYPNISDVHTVQGPASSAASISIDTRDGSDQVFLISAGVPVTISPSAGATEAVEIGSANGSPGLSENVTGPVTMQNNSGSTSLFANDFAEAVSRNVSITDSSVTGLTPNPINFDASVNQIQVRTSDVANALTVNNTTGAKTLVVEDHADDTVNVKATAAGSTLLIGGINGGHASVNITNNGSARGILGGIILDTTDEFLNVTIDDSADTTARNITIGADGKVTGIAPAIIDLQNVEIKNLTITGGSGGNQVLWQPLNTVINDIPSTANLNAGAGNDTVLVPQNETNNQLKITGGGGSDQVFIGVTPSNGGSAVEIRGPVNVANPSGAIDITVNNSVAFGFRTNQVTDTGESQATTAPVTWQSPRSVSLVGSSSNAMTIGPLMFPEAWDVTPSATTTFNIDGGMLATSPNFPDDTLFVDTTNTTSPTLNATSTAGNGLQGSYTFANAKPVNFTRIGKLLGSIFGKVSNAQTGLPIANATMFLDANGDGSFDTGDPSTTTDAGGNYIFKVATGAYQVGQVVPQGLANTATMTLSAAVPNGLPAPAVNFADVPPASAGGPDLTGTFMGHLASSVVGGAAGKAKIRVTNNSATATAAGPSRLTLFASVDTTLDATATAISPVIALGNLKLKPHASKTFTASFKFPSSLADGDYFILASVDSNNAIAESDETNNVAASATKVHIAAPFVDLTGTFGNLPASIKRARGATLTMLIKDSGNAPATSTIAVDVYASTDQTLDTADDSIVASQVPLKIKIKPDKSGSAQVRVPGITTAAAGKYFLIAVLNSTQTLAESNFANNQVISRGQVALT
jgi:hypothetical protein